MKHKQRTDMKIGSMEHLRKEPRGVTDIGKIIKEVMESR